ncbi:hypothetical protein HK102_010284 [Quaeritorhiza haematococci]|nr:hypothetical protein HK102_010284 [Quaeritorhiza haematococci]
MMKSSKLNYHQQRLLENCIRDTSSLPSAFIPHNSRSAASPSPTATIASSTPDRLNGHVKPQLRTRDQIVQSGAFELEPWRPRPYKNYETEKAHLQRKMVTSGNPDASISSDEDEDYPANEGVGLDSLHMVELDGSGAVARRSGPKLRGQNPKGKLRRRVPMDKDEGADEFEMVLTEIEERRQWLDDMIALGHGQKYRQQIQSEIALRIRRLEKLDKERSRFLGLQAITVNAGTAGGSAIVA